MSDNILYTKRLMGTFIFTLGLFVLLLAITNIFNNLDYIQEYKECINIAESNPDMLNTCRDNATEGLNITIRSNQIKLTVGQYSKVYFTGIIQVLFAILLMIFGKYMYIFKKKENISKKVVKRKKRKK